MVAKGSMSLEVATPNKLSLLSSMVQAFAVSTVKVSKGLGLSIKVDKGAIAPGIRAQASCAAALIGVIGENFKGSASILIDHKAFSYIITAMSGGMLSNPSTEDPVAMSALGELANMICGSAIQCENFCSLHIVLEFTQGNCFRLIYEPSDCTNTNKRQQIYGHNKALFKFVVFSKKPERIKAQRRPQRNHANGGFEQSKKKGGEKQGQLRIKNRGTLFFDSVPSFFCAET